MKIEKKIPDHLFPSRLRRITASNSTSGCVQYRARRETGDFSLSPSVSIPQLFHSEYSTIPFILISFTQFQSSSAHVKQLRNREIAD